MKTLTLRQEMVLQYIAEYIRQHTYPPTYQEIADAFHIASKHGVVRHLEALERKGYITRNNTLARSIRIVHPQYMPTPDTVQLPLVGRVAAGYPMLAEENIEEYVMLPRTLIKSEGRYFALRVHGDSMMNAGILDGDMVVVQSTSLARVGEIVVALLGDEVTVKRLVERNGEKFLKAENPAYPDIRPRGEWSIQGRVVSLIRDHVS
ncbi:repressor LexA [candidate division KSB1 bacterium 4484_188]|nr:MAG: repressor LexA [candidate division KSB1 bacterium 4484_188]